MPSTIDKLKILGIAGSMRSSSHSTMALEMTLETAAKYGAEVRLLDLRKTKMPIYDPNGEPDIEEAASAVSWADAFILATPDYHGSMSGALKNFLDHFFEEFAGKTFGYIVASHEKGLTVMDQMRTAVRQCYGWSMPYGVSINGGQDFANGKITNPRVDNRLKMLARDLVIYGKLVRMQYLSDLAGDESNTFAAHYR